MFFRKYKEIETNIKNNLLPKIKIIDQLLKSSSKNNINKATKYIDSKIKEEFGNCLDEISKNELSSFFVTLKDMEKANESLMIKTYNENSYVYTYAYISSRIYHFVKNYKHKRDAIESQTQKNQDKTL